MSMPKGKYVSIDPNHPDGVGVCDYSGFVFNHSDLVRQMAWRGDALVWTGFLVGKPFVDIPNEQARPPRLKPDPVPFKNPRYPQGQTEIWSNNNLNAWAQIFVPWASIMSTNFGVDAPAYSVRIQNLQLGIPVFLPSNGSYVEAAYPQLSPQQITQELEETHWND